MLRNLTAALAAAAAWVATAAATGPAAAASFNCRTADTASERAICRHHKLSELDVSMSRLYFAVHDRIDAGAQAQLLDTQRRFLDARFECGGDVRCLGYAYELRIGDLRDLLATLKEDANRAANSYRRPVYEPAYNPYRKPAY